MNKLDFYRQKIDWLEDFYYPWPKTSAGNKVEQPIHHVDLEKFIDHFERYEGMWVHFNNDDLVAPPKSPSNWLMPRAVYGLSVNQILFWAKNLHAENIKKNRKKTYPGRYQVGYFESLGYNRRLKAHIIEPVGDFVSNESLFKGGFDTCTANLNSFMLKEFENIFERERLDIRMRNYFVEEKNSYAYNSLVLYMYYNIEQSADKILRIDQSDADYKMHPLKPFLLQDLINGAGFNGIIDVNAALTGEFFHQIAITNPKGMHLVASIDNPIAAEVDEKELREFDEFNKKFQIKALDDFLRCLTEDAVSMKM